MFAFKIYWIFVNENKRDFRVEQLMTGLYVWMCLVLTIASAAVVPTEGIGEVLDGPWDNVSS